MMKSVSSLIGHCRHSVRAVAHVRVERPFILLARFAGLSGHEPEIAGAKRRAVARHRGYLVARRKGLVLDREARARHGRHDLHLDRLSGAREALMQVGGRGWDRAFEHLVADLVIGMHRALRRVVLIDAHDVGKAGTDLPSTSSTLL